MGKGATWGCQLHPGAGWPKITTGSEHQGWEIPICQHVHRTNHAIDSVATGFRKKRIYPTKLCTCGQKKCFPSFFQGCKLTISLFFTIFTIRMSFFTVSHLFMVDYLAGSFWLHALQLLSWPHSLVLCGAIITCCSSGLQWQWAQEKWWWYCSLQTVSMSKNDWTWVISSIYSKFDIGKIVIEPSFWLWGFVFKS